MDLVLEQIKSLLSEAESDAYGRLRLPTERELAKRLEVQRSTVRERLAALEAVGIIERTQGSGTYLRMPTPTVVQLYFDMALRLEYITVEQLNEAREMLEVALVQTAAVNVTDDDMTALEGAVERMLHATSAEEGDEADYDFHLFLARASSNPVLLLIFEGLASVLRTMLKRRREVVKPERTNCVHVAIVEALRKHDPDAAREAMVEHFHVWNQEWQMLNTPQETQVEARS